MDYHKEMINYFAKILISEYGIDENDFLFKSTSKDSIYVFFKGDLILSIDYIVFEDMNGIVVDIIITNRINNITERSMLSLSKYCNYDLEFQNNIIKLLEGVNFIINKETTVVNNAQEIIEITRKAKEDNIKEDIDKLESLILEKARDGREGLMFKLSKLKSDILKEESDNDIFKHFRNKGFKCSISNGYSDRYLNITWGD